MGVEHVPWFRRHRSSAMRKSPEFPRRNAKTRWDEPAGLERNGHVAVTKFMEAAQGGCRTHRRCRGQTSSYGKGPQAESSEARTDQHHQERLGYRWCVDLLGRSLWRGVRRFLLAYSSSAYSSSGDLHTMHLNANRISDNSFTRGYQPNLVHCISEIDF